MFKNYLKIAFRNISRHKGYSLINIFGLAIGIICCIFIFLYVHQELSYDRYHADHNRIFAPVSPPLAPALKKNFPQVEFAGRFMDLSPRLVKYSLFPGYPFEYYFLDESFNKQYLAEERTGGLFGVFTILG